MTAGHHPAVVARILQISRQATYRIPRPRRAHDRARQEPVDEGEAAIVAVAEANPTDLELITLGDHWPPWEREEESAISSAR